MQLRAVPAALSGLVLISLLLCCNPPSVNGQAFLPATMMEAIDAASVLTAFKDYASKAGFSDMFNSPEFNGTVFAPNDLAFAAAGFSVPPPLPPLLVEQEGPEVPANASNASSTAGALAATANASGTPASGLPVNATLKSIISFHVVHHTKVFPLTRVKKGTPLITQEGHPLYIDRTPGVVHLYGNVPTKDPTNFATILQYQEVQGGKAVLYLIDKVLKPPKV